MAALPGRHLESVRTARRALFVFREQGRDVDAECVSESTRGVEPRAFAALEPADGVAADAAAIC